MDFFKKSSLARDIIFIIVGTFLMSIAISLVYDPMSIVNGGVTGIGIILNHLFNIPISLSNLVINIPIFALYLVVIGRKSTAKSLFASLLLTAFLAIWDILPELNLCGDDILLAAIYGGIFSGVGIGLVFLASTTTGGTDMLAALLQRKMRHYTLPQIMFVLDGLVILAGLATFGVKNTMYAIITIYVTNKISDAILEGFKFAKVAYIITDHGKEIADAILVELDRGVTGFDATGMYSGNHKDVLMCAVGKKEIVKVLDIVNKIDPIAFVTVHDAREVMGEGFVENTH